MKSNELQGGSVAPGGGMGQVMVLNRVARISRIERDFYQR